LWKTIINSLINIISTHQKFEVRQIAADALKELIRIRSPQQIDHSSDIDIINQLLKLCIALSDENHEILIDKLTETIVFLMIRPKTSQQETLDLIVFLIECLNSELTRAGILFRESQTMCLVVKKAISAATEKGVNLPKNLSVLLNLCTMKSKKEEKQAKIRSILFETVVNLLQGFKIIIEQEEISDEKFEMEKSKYNSTFENITSIVAHCMEYRQIPESIFQSFNLLKILIQMGSIKYIYFLVNSLVYIQDISNKKARYGSIIRAVNEFVAACFINIASNYQIETLTIYSDNIISARKLKKQRGYEIKIKNKNLKLTKSEFIKDAKKEVDVFFDRGIVFESLAESNKFISLTIPNIYICPICNPSSSLSPSPYTIKNTKKVDHPTTSLAFSSGTYNYQILLSIIGSDEGKKII